MEGISNRGGMVDDYVFRRRAWRYQRGNQNPKVEEGQTTQWPKEKGQKNKKRSTKQTHTTTNNPICGDVYS